MTDPTTEQDDALRAFEQGLDGMNVPVPFSDDGLASDMAFRYGLNWRYIADWGQWVRWTGTSWERDETGLIFNAVRLFCREIANSEQGCAMQESARQKLTSRTRHTAVESVLKTDPTLATRATQWDADPLLLSTPGGIVDLRTGTLRPAVREDYQTMVTTAEPGGDCPQWLAFVEWAAGGDVELVAYLQRLCGYSITGLATEQMLAFFYGTGQNGKGVFMRTIAAVLGTYATSASSDIFTDSHNTPHKNVFARLQNKRLVTLPEFEQGKRFAEARIAQFTGGDMIQANFMHENEFEFKPTFTFIFSGNNQPELKSINKAMRRRIQMVPWNVTVKDEERDNLLEQKLLEESAGILQWMVEGCLHWQQYGLCPPEAVTAATEEYIEAEDALGQWLEEHCDIAPGLSVGTGELYRDYVAFCGSIKEQYPWSQKRLVSNLQSRGLARDRLNGLRVIRGIDLKPGVSAEVEERRW